MNGAIVFDASTLISLSMNGLLGELKKLLHNPKPIILTILSNWIWAPLVTTFLAYLFLAGHDQLIVSLILLGSSPCTAMVLVWGALANGNQEQNFINTSLNTISIMFLYAPIVSLLTGIQNIQIDRMTLLISVFVFIGIPLVLGYISKKYITRTKGEAWFLDVYRPTVGKIAILAGVDESPKRLTKLKDNDLNIQTYLCSSTKLCIEDESFDIVLTSHILHELKLFGRKEELKSTLKEIRRVHLSLQTVV